VAAFDNGVIIVISVKVSSSSSRRILRTWFIFVSVAAHGSFTDNRRVKRIAPVTAIVAAVKRLMLTVT